MNRDTGEVHHHGIDLEHEPNPTRERIRGYGGLEAGTLQDVVEYCQGLEQ